MKPREFAGSDLATQGSMPLVKAFGPSVLKSCLTQSNAFLYLGFSNESACNLVLTISTGYPKNQYEKPAKAPEKPAFQSATSFGFSWGPLSALSAKS